MNPRIDVVPRAARSLALLCSSLAVAATCVAAPAKPATTSAHCDGVPVTVVGAGRVERADICRGAGQALAFMSARGLDKVSAFTIEATSRLPDVVGRSAAGCYLQSHDRAYVLTYAQFRRRQTWFGVPVSRALYRSLVTHESAHAIAACNFNVAAPSIQAREYIAYVAMFSTMPAGLRTRALAALPGSGFDELDHVNSIVYLFDPMRFGAESYRHFVAQPDGAAVLRDVLDGRALAE